MANGIMAERAAALPGKPGRTLAPGMGELDAERGRARAAAQRHDPGQRRLVRLRIEAEAAMADAAARLDRGLLDDDEARARQRQRPQMLQVPIIGRAVLGAVLAHRRHRDPVGEGEAAEGHRLEQTARRFHRHASVVASRCRPECAASVHALRAFVEAELAGGASWRPRIGQFPAPEAGAANGRRRPGRAPRIAQAAAVEPRAIVANAAVHPFGSPAPPNASSATPTATGPINAAV